MTECNTQHRTRFHAALKGQAFTVKLLSSTTPGPQPLPHELGVSRITALSGVWVEGVICSSVEATLLHANSQPALGFDPIVYRDPHFSRCQCISLVRDKFGDHATGQPGSEHYVIESRTPRQRCHPMLHPPKIQLHFALFEARR